MLGLLQSVPWFVIVVFAASAVLAVAAGRPSRVGNPGGDSGLATRAVGFVYAVAVATVVLLWVREQVR